MGERYHRGIAIGEDGQPEPARIAGRNSALMEPVSVGSHIWLVTNQTHPPNLRPGARGRVSKLGNVCRSHESRMANGNSSRSGISYADQFWSILILGQAVCARARELQRLARPLTSSL